MANKFTYIYALTEQGKLPTPENIRYIGKTSRYLHNRLRQHIVDSLSYNLRVSNWIKSISTSGLRPDIHPIIVVENSQASEMEIKTIALYRKLNSNLTNLTAGGDGASSGADNPLFGKHLSDITKRKISLSHLGKRHSEETKKKMSITRTGKKHPNGHIGLRHSEETKKKMSESLMGNTRWLGKHHSEGTKKKIAVGNMKPKPRKIYDN